MLKKKHTLNFIVLLKNKYFFQIQIPASVGLYVENHVRRVFNLSNHISVTFLSFSCQTMPVAMALLRDVQNLCPKDVLNFILDLIKYNDNRKNKVKAQIHTFIFQLVVILQDFIRTVDKTLQIHIISLVIIWWQHEYKKGLCLFCCLLMSAYGRWL